MASVFFIMSQIYHTAFPESSYSQYIINRPNLPLPVLIFPKHIRGKSWHILNEFNNLFPYPLIRPAVSRDEANIIMFVMSVYEDEDISLKELAINEYRRIYGERKAKISEDFVKKHNLYQISERFPCRVYELYDADLGADPRIRTKEVEPGLLIIEISLKKSLFEHRFKHCLREEIAHAFFLGGLPDRRLKEYERSIFNRGGDGYQVFIDDYTWSDILTMKVLLYAIETNRRSRADFKEVIWDYFLSRLFE